MCQSGQPVQLFCKMDAKRSRHQEQLSQLQELRLDVADPSCGIKYVHSGDNADNVKPHIPQVSTYVDQVSQQQSVTDENKSDANIVQAMDPISSQINESSDALGPMHLHFQFPFIPVHSFDMENNEVQSSALQTDDTRDDEDYDSFGSDPETTASDVENYETFIRNFSVMTSTSSDDQLLSCTAKPYTLSDLSQISPIHTHINATGQEFNESQTSSILDADVDCPPTPLLEPIIEPLVSIHGCPHQYHTQDTPTDDAVNTGWEVILPQFLDGNNPGRGVVKHIQDQHQVVTGTTSHVESSTLDEQTGETE